MHTYSVTVEWWLNGERIESVVEVEAPEINSAITVALHDLGLLNKPWDRHRYEVTRTAKVR
jgi:hypothetical protein